MKNRKIKGGVFVVLTVAGCEPRGLPHAGQCHATELLWPTQD